MSKIRDRVIKELEDRCRSMITASHYNQLDETQFRNYIEGILSIPELAIVDRKAQPPIRFIHPDDSSVLSYEKCKEDMLKVGYIKEVKDE